jgi:hypothetical protein
VRGVGCDEPAACRGHAPYSLCREDVRTSRRTRATTVLSSPTPRGVRRREMEYLQQLKEQEAR